MVGFVLGLDELAEPQRRFHDADARLDGDGLGIRADRLAKRFERLAIAGFFEQQRAELKLQAGVVDVAPLHTRNQGHENEPRPPTPSEVESAFHPLKQDRSSGLGGAPAAGRDRSLPPTGAILMAILPEASTTSGSAWR